MMSDRQRWRVSLVVAAAGGLLFQVFHLIEHSVQMVMWVRYPQRAPFMSPWAHEASLRLGQVQPGRSSETTLAVARGMEYLHLGGNLVFLGGIVAVWLLARSEPEAAKRSRTALLVQGLHVAEHVVLVSSLLIWGRPVGVSTGFGYFSGTQLSTFRVWWHGGVNLLATVLAISAVVALSTAARGERSTQPRRLMGPAISTMLVPLILALGVGHAAGSAAASHADHESVDDIAGFHLVDVAVSVGLDVQHSAFRWDVTMDPVAMMGGGVCWIDVDRDGWLDLFVTDTWSDGEWGLWNSANAIPTTRIFRNVEGRFEEYTEAWSAGFAARANGCVAADLDGDGYTDIYVTTSRENLLLWNDGGSGFVEGAKAAGVDAYGWHTGVAAGDIDGDGATDLVVAGYANLNSPVPEASTGFPNTFAPVRDLVYLNQGSGVDGRAEFAAVDAGLERDGAEYGLGVVLTDVDLDGDLDLHIANDTQPNRLYLNESSEASGLALRDISATSGTDDPNSGMGIAVGDTNGDAYPDLVVTNLAEQGHASLVSAATASDSSPVYEAKLDEVYAQGLAATGWGAAFGDLDRDGQLDLLVASGAIPITTLAESAEAVVFFCGLDATPGYDDQSDRVGLNHLAERNGRAVALADYDNDGDVDAVVTAIGQPLVLLENRGAPGQWISFDPQVPDPALRVQVSLSDGTVIERQSSSGGSWLSSHDHRINIGYPDGVTVDDVTVLSASQTPVVREGRP